MAPPAAADKPKDDAKAAEKKPAVKRDYSVFQTLKLDPSNAVETAQKLSAFGEGEVVVLVRIGTGTGFNPKGGLEAVAGDVELSGDYDVVADNSINHFDGVKSETKRVVSIG